MELSRRAVLRFGALTGASLMLPRFAGKKRDRGPGTIQFGVDPIAVHDYEEGADGEIIGKGQGVVAVAGRPRYSAADAAHGIMGWTSSATDSGGGLVYENPDPSGSSGSVYLVPRLIPQGTPTTVVTLLPDRDSLTANAQIRLTSDGRVDITDSLGTRQTATASIWQPFQRVRLDWAQAWSKGTLTLLVWPYVTNGGETWRPPAVQRASFAADSSPYVSIGQESSQATIGFDTYRVYDCPTMPPPYEPVIGAALSHTYDDGVNGKPVLIGQDGVVSVTGTPKYSAKAARHGTLGVHVAVGDCGILRYENPYPPAHTGSLCGS